MKYKKYIRHTWTVFFLLTVTSALLLSFSGCAVRHIQLAELSQKNNKYDDALKHYFKALNKEPDNIGLRLKMDALLKDAAAFYYKKGKLRHDKGDLKNAVLYYRKSLEFDPGNSDSLNALKILTDTSLAVKSAETIKKELAINTGLPAVLQKTEKMDLMFKNPTSLKAIFEVLARMGKVNILFDFAYKDKIVTLQLKDITFYTALERISQLFAVAYYVLDDNNIIISLEGGDAEKRYKKLLMKNFYFANVDAQEAKKIISSVLKPDNLVVNQLTNSLIVTDTIEVVSLVERLVNFIDKRKGEVELEVEILEVDKKKIHEYGTELSAWQTGLSLDNTQSGVLFDDIGKLSKNDLRFSVPQAVWKLFSTITDSKILARPTIRGIHAEPINIQLGEKRPIPRTTFVPVAQGGVNQQPITSYTLTDVGITLTITPTVHNNREVTLDLKFELTNVVDVGSAFVPPTLGSRRVSTVLRLRDGETGVIAGLMKGTTTGSRTGIPILNSIPLIKELFSSNSKLNERTDILLSITPRILRMPEITSEDTDAYLIGTRDKMELKRWQGYNPANVKKNKKSPNKKSKDKNSPDLK